MNAMPEPGRPDRGQTRACDPAQLPARGGLGLKPEHFRAVLETRPEVGFFEVHAENYMVAGGPMHHFLGRIRADYPLSIHGVGLSIGGLSPPDPAHLERLARLLERYQPQAFSEHLAWSSHGGHYLNDLLPLPYTDATLQRVCAHIDAVQTRLGRTMLLENPATYIEFAESTWPEAEFVAEVVARTGCGLLLDVNNVYVSCVNHGRDPQQVLRQLPLHAVQEIHLAGFAEERDGAESPLLIDSHSTPVAQAVWDLFREVVERIGPRPSLLERDGDLPALDVLLAELAFAAGILTDAGRARVPA